jgi:toxin ParE1/3/4
MIESNFKIKYSKLFREELQDAIKWYDLQKKGLGRELKVEANNVIKDIVLNPTFASVKYDETRVVACNIFPYTIHYKVYESKMIVRIVSFFHTRRRPNWL